MWRKSYLRCFIYNHCFAKITCCLMFETWLSNDMVMDGAVFLKKNHSVAEHFKKDVLLRYFLAGKDVFCTRTCTFKVKPPIHTS